MIERVASGEDVPFAESVIVEGRIAFVSGQGPILDGSVMSGSIEEQVELSLANLDDCLRRLGVDRAAVVSCTCYLADLGDLEPFNAVYRKHFAPRFPARTTVQAQLISNIKVEISAVAALPTGDDRYQVAAR